MNMQQFNQNLVMHDPLVGEIHDRLMDDNGLDLAHAFNQACAEIAELYLHIDRMAKGTSSGFMRKKANDND